MSGLDTSSKNHQEFSLDPEQKSQDLRSRKKKFSLQSEQTSRHLALPIEEQQQALNEFDASCADTEEAKELVFCEERALKAKLDSAQVLVDAKDYDLASQMLERMLEVDQNLESLYLLGSCYYAQEKYDEAMVLFRQALEKVTDDSPVVFELYKDIGNIFVRQQDFAGAEEFYHKAYAMNPGSDVLLVNMGTLEVQKGELEKARGHFRHAVKVNPENERGWVGLALTHRACADHELAWANVSRALDISPDNKTAIQLGLEWGVKDGRLDEVEVLLSKYLTKVESDLEIAQAMVKVKFLKGNLRQALDCCEEYLKQFDGDGPLRALHKLISAQLKMVTEKISDRISERTGDV